jgi:hypothetical protein
MHEQALLPDPVAVVAIDLDIIDRLRRGTQGQRLNSRCRAVLRQQSFAGAKITGVNPAAAVGGPKRMQGDGKF